MDNTEFWQSLKPVTTDAPAFDAQGMRTIYGYWDAADASLLASHNSLVGESTISTIARMMNEPRLLEVSAIAELLERYLERSFSKLSGIDFPVANNPLSILFWSHDHNRPQRIKPRETELFHKPFERMFLRNANMREINDFLASRYGLVITGMHSCGGSIVAEKHLADYLASDFYQKRESFDRRFDTDVLAVSGDVFEGISVQDVPDSVLSQTADFGPAEVRSFVRFARAVTNVWQVNRVRVVQGEHLESAREFLKRPVEVLPELVTA